MYKRNIADIKQNWSDTFSTADIPKLYSIEFWARKVYIIFCPLSEIMSKIITKPVTFGGPTTEGSPYWKFKNDIKEVFRNHKKVKSEFGIEIELSLEKSRVAKDKNDLDNFLKPIIDALNEISIIEEHKMESIKISRILVDDSSGEGVDITLTPTIQL